MSAEQMIADGNLAEGDALKAKAGHAAALADDMEQKVNIAAKSVAVVKAEQAAGDAFKSPVASLKSNTPALTDDERIDRFLRVLDIARELPPYRPDSPPRGRTPIMSKHRAVVFFATDSEFERLGLSTWKDTDDPCFQNGRVGAPALAEFFDIPTRLAYFTFEVTDVLCWNQDDRLVLLDRIAMVLSALRRGNVPHRTDPDSHTFCLPFKF